MRVCRRIVSQIVHNQNFPRSHPANLAYVHDPAITGVSLQRWRTGIPREHTGLRKIPPRERTGRRRLIQPIDAYRVMRRGAAKSIAPFWLADVSVGAGINQNFPISPAMDEGE